MLVGSSHTPWLTLQAQVPICGWLMVVPWCFTLSGCRGWLLRCSNYFLCGDIGLFRMEETGHVMTGVSYMKINNWKQTTGGGQKLRTGSLVLPVADNIFQWMYFASVSNLGPSSKQNRGKIHSLKNVVCYRKDKASGTQFLPSPCGLYIFKNGNSTFLVISLSFCSRLWI